ncbi:MAG: HEPN domain-containing protein [Candidatus Helarchaeota archaeon]
MEKKEELIEIAKELVSRGENKLQSAQLLLENNQIDDAISRAYYAAFLVTRGLLYLLGTVPKSHSGLITLFGLKVIKTGLLEPKIGRALNQLFEARETSDYAVTFFYTKEDGANFIQIAREIIEAIKSLMKDKFKIEFS